MACPDRTIQACDFVQALVDETPFFDERIERDTTVHDGWVLHVATQSTPTGTPVEITQDRFRGVWPNVTKAWQDKVANGVGCTGNPCDPTEHEIGWGADRLTFNAITQSWRSPLVCYDQMMHITHAKQHVDQIVSDVFKPATSAILSNLIRKQALELVKYKHQANASMTTFTSEWVAVGDDEIYLDTSADPATTFMLTPQMLQNNYGKTMREGYAGVMPFKNSPPGIELVADMDTAWFLDKLGGQQGVGPGNTPNVQGNWRFTEWNAANEYWRYGYSGSFGNYNVRVDELNLRFNYVTDLGAGAHGGNGNRYRYQVVLPYYNSATTGAGGAAGIGRNVNSDFDRAHFTLTFQWHKKVMMFMVPEFSQINPEWPFGDRSFYGDWQFVQHDLGADVNGRPIENKRRNKGMFIADFLLWPRPGNTEFGRAYFHKREQFCIAEISPCSADPGYPAQSYDSAMPVCE